MWVFLTWVYVFVEHKSWNTLFPFFIVFVALPCSVLPSVKNKSTLSKSDGCSVAQEIEIHLASQTNKKECVQYLSRHTQEQCLLPCSSAIGEHFHYVLLPLEQQPSLFFADTQWSALLLWFWTLICKLYALKHLLSMDFLGKELLVLNSERQDGKSKPCCFTPTNPWALTISAWG